MQDTLIVFDIDGTLLDSVSLHQAAFLRTLKSFSFNAINSDWASYRHHTDSWIFSEVFRSNQGVSPEHEIMLDFDMRLRGFFSQINTPEVISEIPGALEFLSRLEMAGVKYAFATGGMRSITLEKLKILGDGVFDIPMVTGSEHQERENIVSGAVETAAQKFGRSFARVISIGDGIWDAITARNLGYEFIGIQQQPEKLASHCAPHTIYPHFRDLDLDTLAEPFFQESLK